MNIGDKYRKLLTVDNRTSQGEVKTPLTLVNEILDRLPKELFESSDTTFLDPCFGNGTFLIEVIKRLRKEGHSVENIQERVCGVEISHRLYNKVNKLLSNYNFHKLCKDDFLKKDFKNMKFNVIVGNPPYQDGSKAGGQNKIYMLFCKQALEMLTDEGKLAFVTPTSVAKTSKRFTLENLPGLKYIDYTADNHFTVGSEICSWMVDKEFVGDVTLCSNAGEELTGREGPFFDSSKHSTEFVKLYKALKATTPTPQSRMFKQNNFGPAMKKETSELHINTLHKLTKAGDIEITYWTNRTPYFQSDRKISIAMTKSLKPELIIDSSKNFDVGYMTTNIDDNQQLENIKSFILSDYFLKHSERWKSLDGYGFNYALKYLPPFDKNKQWDSKSVEEFLQSFNR